MLAPGPCWKLWKVSLGTCERYTGQSAISWRLRPNVGRSLVAAGQGGYLVCRIQLETLTSKRRTVRLFLRADPFAPVCLFGLTSEVLRVAFRSR